MASRIGGGAGKVKLVARAFATADDLKAFNSDDINVLYNAIKHLSEIDRAVILLYLEEKSYSEIAEIIGANTNSIGVRITRIKERLNKFINAQE